MNETRVQPKEHVIRKRFHNIKFGNARLRKKFPLQNEDYKFWVNEYNGGNFLEIK